MSSLYPSLEDMKVDHMRQAEETHRHAAAATSHAICYPPQSSESNCPAKLSAPPQASPYPPQASLYPALEEYMGLSLSPAIMQQNMQVATATSTQLSTRYTPTGSLQVAPVTRDNQGLLRAEIKQGVRQVVLCKDQDKQIGLRVRSVNKGLFVAFVHRNSPAALAGLRFGDQILQINNELVAGWDTDKAMKFLKKCSPERITMAVRDRPFERTITMQKDSTGNIGFLFKQGKIQSIVKDSSAARNGILTEHHLIEVDGQNVVGLKDKEIAVIVEAAPRTVTVTIIPSFIYEHILKNIGSSMIKKNMDHSIPDV